MPTHADARPTRNALSPTPGRVAMARDVFRDCRDLGIPVEDALDAFNAGPLASCRGRRRTHGRPDSEARVIVEDGRAIEVYLRELRPHPVTGHRLAIVAPWRLATRGSRCEAETPPATIEPAGEPLPPAAIEADLIPIHEALVNPMAGRVLLTIVGVLALLAGLACWGLICVARGAV